MPNEEVLRGLAESVASIREEYEGACSLVAKMHAAAVGEVTGPILGVVEDVERLRSERLGWEETAARHCRNEEYYHGLVVEIGKMLGPEAYVSDDGSVQQDILCAKVPELVAKRLALVAKEQTC